MTTRVRFILVFFLCSVLMSGFARAKPIEIKSENFVFYGDASEKRAKELIEGLEKYRAILFTIYNVETGPEFIPVKIVGFKTQRELERVTGRDNIGGIYTTTLEGPLFLMATDDGLRQGKPGWNTAFHEYTHHIMAGFTRTAYPTWYNEGLAEYLSTFKIKDDGKFEIGLPREGRAWTLANLKWIPMEKLIGAVRGYPFRSTGGRANQNAQALFYAQSWLVVHYIQSHPEYSKKAADYFKRIDKFIPDENAFETAFGMSPEEFESIIRKYYKANKYPYKKVQLDKTVTISDVHVREISKAVIKAQQGDALRMLSGSEKGRATSRSYLEDAHEKLGVTESIIVSRALLALQESDYEAATDLAKQAVKLYPDSRHANRVLGIVSLLAYKNLGAEHGSVETARIHLMKAMRAYPDDVTAHYYYAHSFNINNQTPTKQALASADGATNYFRHIRFLKNNLDMAQVYVRAGQADKAAPVLRRVMAWAPVPSARQFAKNELERLGYSSETP